MPTRKFHRIVSFKVWKKNNNNSNVEFDQQSTTKSAIFFAHVFLTVGVYRKAFVPSVQECVCDLVAIACSAVSLCEYVRLHVSVKGSWIERKTDKPMIERTSKRTTRACVYLYLYMYHVDICMFTKQ